MCGGKAGQDLTRICHVHAHTHKQDTRCKRNYLHTHVILVTILAQVRAGANLAHKCRKTKVAHQDKLNSSTMNNLRGLF
jgi:hypothetical protein